jgi:hypothetical protein
VPVITAPGKFSYLLENVGERGEEKPSRTKLLSFFNVILIFQKEDAQRESCIER